MVSIAFGTRFASLCRMLGRILDSKWFYIVAVAGVIGAFLYSVTEVETSLDLRPEGQLEDIAELAKRDDVNVLFVLIDTLRRANLGTYGHPRDTSPQIDYLARTGVLFNRQLSQSSWTKCSMASMWMSLYPVRTGVLKSQHSAPAEATMPAEILKEAGFRTAGIWRNGWIAPNFGFDQGFELYHRPIPDRAKEFKDSKRNPSNKLEGTDVETVDTAMEFLRTYGHERWFLYLHMMDVHQYVYDENSALFGTDYTDIYDNSIRRTDDVLDRLFKKMSRAGHMEDTIVVVAVDHGEAFGEHGREGHARDVYGEVTEVPFVIGLPFKLDPGVVITTPSENIDIWPTLLDMLGLPPLPEADGQSRMPEILAAAAGNPLPLDEEEVRFAQLDQTWAKASEPANPMISVSQGKYRFIYSSAHPDKGQLFDKDTDPKEQYDIAATNPDLADKMKGLAETYLTFPPPSWGGAQSIELDEMQLNQLRALGYQLP
jgi:arylsulfatase A-like enzyme